MPRHPKDPAAAGTRGRKDVVDLDAPDRGVQRTPGRPVAPMGHVLTRKAVLDKTWHDIVILLAAHRNADEASSR